MTTRTGKCLCGAVRFVAGDMGDEFSTCYCGARQRWGGGAFRGIGVAPDKLDIEGRDNIGTIQGSDFAERAFCTECGSSIWYRPTAGKHAGQTSISVGLLDETDGLVLKYEPFTDHQNSTDVIPEAIGRHMAADVEQMIAEFTAEESQ